MGGCRVRVLSWHKWPSGIWFRVFGYGLAIMDARENPALFSERYGYRRFYYWRHWKIQPLQP